MSELIRRIIPVFDSTSYCGVAVHIIYLQRLLGKKYLQGFCPRSVKAVTLDVTDVAMTTAVVSMAFMCGSTASASTNAKPKPRECQVRSQAIDTDHFGLSTALG